MKKIFTILIFFFAAFVLNAQSADVMTDILKAEEVTYGQISYLSACHQGILTEEVSYDEALEALKSIGQVKSSAQKDDVIKLDEITAMFSCMWKIKGGLFYRMTNASPRYAYKQFKADSVVSENSDPKQTYSGEDLLNLYTKCMIKYGNMKLDVSE